MTRKSYHGLRFEPESPRSKTGVLTKADVIALVAMNAGNANADQQKRALEAIVYKVAGITSTTFDPESDRSTAHAEGCRHVGLEIMRVVQDSVAILKSFEAEKAKPARKKTPKTTD